MVLYQWKKAIYYRKFTRQKMRNLITIKNYSLKVKKTPQRIYQMAAEGKIKMVEIDKVKFIEE
jgi:hypothetical protein